MDLAMDVFGETKRFPTHERFSLVDQIRRSSRSVASNVAEAWRKRRYPAAFISKLNDAEGEAAETQSHIAICARCGYLDGPTAKKLDDAYEEVLSMLVKMAAHPDKWVIRAEREEEE
jgi:four helix bundle protein